LSSVHSTLGSENWVRGSLFSLQLRKPGFHADLEPGKKVGEGLAGGGTMASPGNSPDSSHRSSYCCSSSSWSRSTMTDARIAEALEDAAARDQRAWDEELGPPLPPLPSTRAKAAGGSGASADAVQDPKLGSPQSKSSRSSQPLEKGEPESSAPPSQRPAERFAHSVAYSKFLHMERKARGGEGKRSRGDAKCAYDEDCACGGKDTHEIPVGSGEESTSKRARPCA